MALDLSGIQHEPLANMLSDEEILAAYRKRKAERRAKRLARRAGKPLTPRQERRRSVRELVEDIRRALSVI
jgi:hypothetical protein